MKRQNTQSGIRGSVPWRCPILKQQAQRESAAVAQCGRLWVLLSISREQRGWNHLISITARVEGTSQRKRLYRRYEQRTPYLICSTGEDSYFGAFCSPNLGIAVCFSTWSCNHFITASRLNLAGVQTSEVPGWDSVPPEWDVEVPNGN